jgi:hypothetical protein
VPHCCPVQSGFKNCITEMNKNKENQDLGLIREQYK